MKLKDLTNDNIQALGRTIEMLTEYTLEKYDNSDAYFLMDHPDTSDETTNVETVQDLVHFALLFGLAKGAKDKQEEIRKVLGMP